MIILFIIVGLLVGLGFGIVNGLSPPKVEAAEPEPIPYYIDEQIDAIYNQLQANHDIIKGYRVKLEYTTDTDTVNLYNKCIADLEYKNSRLEEKVYKLLEKWEC